MTGFECYCEPTSPRSAQPEDRLLGQEEREMAIPKDVEALLGTLRDLGVDAALVAKAGEILGRKADDIGEWNELAVALRQREQYHAALVTFDAALRRFPRSHLLWSNRGYVLLVWGHYQQALKSFAKALAIKPDYVHALACKAAAYERLQQFEQAAATYREVLRLEPSHARAWNSLGVCLRELGNEAEAIQCYEKAIEADPEFTDPLFNLAGLYSSRREYDRALPYVSRLLELAPGDRSAQRLRDEILAQPATPRSIGVDRKPDERIDPLSANLRGAGWRNNLYRPDGSRRPDTEVVAEQGKIGLRLALLDAAVHDRVQPGKFPVHYPPRLFLSYKWGSDKANQWVARLAEKLARRGWDVVFDGYRDETVDRSVEKFVSRIGTCRVFLAIATPEYIAHAINPSQQPSWVFDEYQAALMDETAIYRIALAPDGRVAAPESRDTALFRLSETADRILPDFPPIIFEDGKPRVAVPAVVMQTNRRPRFDEILAMPDEDGLDELLDRHLTYDGPRLGDSERSEIVEVLSELDRGGHDADDTVIRLQALLAQYPFVFAMWRMLYLELSGAGRLAEAAEVLERAAASVHPRDGGLMLQRERVEVLHRLARPADAMRAASEILKTRPRDWAAHFYVGNRLDDCNELWGARNHLLIACDDVLASAEAFNTLGVIYMGLGFLLRASQCFDTALKRDPSLERAKTNLERTLAAQPPHHFANALKVAGPGTGCTVCSAMYPMSTELPVLCRSCGGRRPILGNCPYCGHDGLVACTGRSADPAAVGCPTCRTGSLATKADFAI